MSFTVTYDELKLAISGAQRIQNERNIPYPVADILNEMAYGAGLVLKSVQQQIADGGEITGETEVEIPGDKLAKSFLDQQYGTTGVCPAYLTPLRPFIDRGA